MINKENIFAIRQAIINQETSGNFLPSVYVVEVASKCNLNCVMCPNSKMDSLDLGFMDTKLFEKIMIKIAPYCEFLMLYWMGEPLLHKDFEELLRIARKHIEGKIVLSTNMTRMNTDIADSICENVDIVLCCIDRWDKKFFERIRIGATFEQVIANTEMLLESKKVGSRCQIVVKALDISHSSEEYRNFERYWLSKGAKPLFAWLNDWAGTFVGMRNAASVEIPRTTKRRTPCADLWFKMVMNWRGEVQMCCFDWQYAYRIGDFVDHDNWLLEIWQSQKITKLRHLQVLQEWPENNICKECKVWAEPEEHEAYIDFDDDSYFVVF